MRSSDSAIQRSSKVVLRNTSEQASFATKVLKLYSERTTMKTCLLFVLLTFVVYAQHPEDNLVFNEQFENNSNKWLAGSNETRSVELTNGKYVMKLLVAGRIQGFWNTPSFNMNQEYIIETELRKTSGDDATDAFGILYGIKDLNNCYRFAVRTDGKVAVYSVTDGTTDYKLPWTDYSCVRKGLSDVNKLTIERRNSAVAFRVNGMLVYSMDETDYFGTMVGYYLEGNSTVEADYLKIYQRNFDTVNVLQTSVPFGERVNIGEFVNSEYSDINPVISPDGNTLYFGKYEPLDPNNTSKTTEQIWYSQLQTDGTWAKAQKALPPLNHSSHCFVISVSPDNNTLLVANAYTQNGLPNGPGVSITNKTTTGWEVPKKITIENEENKSKYVNYFLTNNRKVLISSVERSEGFGALDLYVSFLKNDNTWSIPKNMGNTINTIGDDSAPFVAADDITMYFSSSGHPGYGGNDIYMSRRLDDSWTKWSTPVNLGDRVNTSGFDSYFTIPATGDKAYIVSWQSKERRSDIFTISLPPEARPEPVILVSGKVYDAKTKLPIQATIKYETLPLGKEVGVASSAPQTGDYKIVLPAKSFYGFRAERNDYIPVSDNIDVTKVLSYKEIKRDLYLVPIEQGSVIRINNLFFDFAKSTLRPESFPDLNRIVELLKSKIVTEIQIEGHTDNVGNEVANQKLSESRAKAVLDYLTSHGVDAKSISSKGYGKTKPITTNDSDEGRQQNRRVEFVILKK